MSAAPPAVLLVDPLKTGLPYKKAARDLGLAVVSLYTVEPRELHSRFPDHCDGDDRSLHFTEPAEAVKALAGTGYDVVAVVPAWESAVHTADLIAHALALPGNDVRLARARRDKTAMRARAAEADLRIPAFRVVHSAAEVPAAAAAVGYPAIVKPATSSGAHGVTLIPGAEAAAGFAIAETTDLFGWPITDWLVEQYVRGRELAVNSFSSDGEHRVIDMWEYRQPDGRDYDFPLYDNVEALPDDPDWERVRQYVTRVLNAYGMRRGPSHTEVKVNAEGVFLMEIGGRLPGGPATDQWTAYTDIRPYHDAIECYLGRRPAIMDKPINRRAVFGAIAIRNDDAPGTLVAVHGLEAMRAHPGVDKVLVSYRPGDHVPITCDDKTIPLGAWVSAPDQSGVERVLAELRELVRLEIRTEATG